MNRYIIICFTASIHAVEHHEAHRYQVMMDLYDYIKSKPELVINGFRNVGIVDILIES